jgi:hypothetical protein
MTVPLPSIRYLSSSPKPFSWVKTSHIFKTDSRARRFRLEIPAASRISSFFLLPSPHFRRLIDRHFPAGDYDLGLNQLLF